MGETSSRFTIDSETIAKAGDCLDCHSCLDDDEFNLCTVDFFDDESEIMVSFGDQCRACAYGRHFGSGIVCLCPIRKEIRRKYGV